MEPEDVVAAFLEERRRFDEEEPLRKEERLGRFILPGSRARDFLFRKPGFPKDEGKQEFLKTEMGQDRVDIQTWREGHSSHKDRFMLSRVEGQWKISEFYLPCPQCDGKGKARLRTCGRCKGTGWESLSDLMDG